MRSLGRTASKENLLRFLETMEEVTSYTTQGKLMVEWKKLQTKNCTIGNWWELFTAVIAPSWNFRCAQLS